MSLLRSAASAAPVPVLVVPGSADRAAGDLVALDPRVRVVDSPRHAMLLLLVGRLGTAPGEALQRLHDALPHPRATLWWDRHGDGAPPVPARRLDRDADVAAACRQLAARLLNGGEQTEPPLLPDAERHAWRGVGPYGQGGSGMTGGHPYGRAIAGRADDLRDRLSLDVVRVTVGPYFAALPAGMTLRVTFQGDIVHDLDVITLPPADATENPFSAALTAAVQVRRLELERASAHLRWLACALRQIGLGALGERALRASLAPEASPVSRLFRTVSRVVPRAVRGVGALAADAVTGNGLGPVARASGVVEDARSDDPAYRALGFEPVIQRGGDVWARWRQRLDEVEQSLSVARAAGDRSTGGDGRPIEAPYGPVGAPRLDRLAVVLPPLLRGLEWGDAVATVTSLGLDDAGAPVAAAGAP